MADTDKLNIDSIIARLLEGKLSQFFHYRFIATFVCFGLFSLLFVVVR